MKSSIARVWAVSNGALCFALLMFGPPIGWLAADEPGTSPGFSAQGKNAKPQLIITTSAEEPVAASEEAESAEAEEEAEEPGVLSNETEADTTEMPDAQEDNPKRVITPLREKAETEEEETGENDTPKNNPSGPISATRLLPAKMKVTPAPLAHRGVQAGISKKKDLVAAWGAPAEVGKTHGVVTYGYRLKDQPKLTVTLNDGLVTMIVMQIISSRTPQEMAEALGIDNISSVEVADEDGQILGEAFPECGVLFAFGPPSQPPKVAQVILEPLDAQPFLLRAEAELDTEFARCLADANCALELEPQSAAALAMRARVYRQAGDLQAALQAAEAAVASEPNEPEWHLVLAKILIQLSDFFRAKEQLDLVLKAESPDPMAMAQAHLLTGDNLALASSQGHAAAVKEHQEAIRLARSLANDPTARRRRKAAELLIDAHLHAAYSIGWGEFQHKAEAVEKWINDAQSQADTLVKQGVLRPDVRLRVSEQALAAMAGLPDPPDPTKWESAALHESKILFDEATDPVRAAQIQWQLGLALCDAMQIEQTRRAYGRALSFGRLAAEHLQRADTIGRQLPDHDFLVGLLFYRLGAIHAIGRKDHKQALSYYHPAVKLLEAPVPNSRFADPGRHGETFVSIAVSYWETGEQEEAIRLTRQGVKLMERAVEEGTLSKSSLTVPYGNLSNMYSEIGDTASASKFSELATKLSRQKR